MEWRIGVIGFGNVGQGFVRILASKRSILENKYDFRYRLVAISDPVKGNAYDEDGIDLTKLIKLLDNYGDIKRYPGYKDLDSLMIAKSIDLDIVVEVTPTNMETGEPGLTHIKTALENKRHVVTSNKGPIALAYNKLRRIAEDKGVVLRFEGTVMSGTPSISLAREALAGCEIYRVEGILNGTTNYILTRMEEGIPFNDALREAQEKGYAEADPSADIDAWDPAIKTVIIANTIFESNLSINDVERIGIRNITLKDVKASLGRNRRIKLVAKIEREGESLSASVKPVELPSTHPLFNISGVTNAITFTTDNLNKVTLIGPGAGRIETGQAILSDILYIHRVHGGM